MQFPKQDRDEGQSGDLRELELEDIRGIIRKKIEGPYGLPSWSKADKMGKEMIPSMSASTIIKFSTGETRRPSAWTIKMMTREAGYRLMMIPPGAKAPAGSFEV